MSDSEKETIAKIDAISQQLVALEAKQLAEGKDPERTAAIVELKGTRRDLFDHLQVSRGQKIDER